MAHGEGHSRGCYSLYNTHCLHTGLCCCEKSPRHRNWAPIPVSVLVHRAVAPKGHKVRGINHQTVVSLFWGPEPEITGWAGSGACQALSLAYGWQFSPSVSTFPILSLSSKNN